MFVKTKIVVVLNQAWVTGFQTKSGVEKWDSFM